MFEHAWFKKSGKKLKDEDSIVLHSLMGRKNPTHKVMSSQILNRIVPLGNKMIQHNNDNASQKEDEGLLRIETVDL